VNLAPGGAPSNPFATPQQKTEPVEEEQPDGGSASLDEPAFQGNALDLIPTSAESSFASGSARLRLLPKLTSVVEGESFEMVVEIATTSPVAHVPLTLSWDPALLELEKAVPGDFLGSGKNAAYTSDGTVPGELALQADRVEGASGVAGNGALMRVRFRALAGGYATVEVAPGRILDAELYDLAAGAAPPSEVEIRAAADSGPTLLPAEGSVAEPDGGS
jgi:hypothetical protein